MSLLLLLGPACGDSPALLELTFSLQAIGHTIVMEFFPTDIAVDRKSIVDSTPPSAAFSQRQECSPCNEFFNCEDHSENAVRARPYRKWRRGHAAPDGCTLLPNPEGQAQCEDCYEPAPPISFPVTLAKHIAPLSGLPGKKTLESGVFSQLILVEMFMWKGQQK